MAVTDEVTGGVISWAGYAGMVELELLRLKVGDNVTISGTRARDACGVICTHTRGVTSH